MPSPLHRFAFSLLLGASSFACCAGDSRDSRAAASRAVASPEISPREAACRALADHLAEALRSPAARARLWVAMLASPEREGKLHLGTFLAGAGSPIAKELGQAAQASGQRLDVLLERAGNLEVYLPVAAHRIAWQGGDELVVATALDDRGGAIYGAAVLGGGVELSREQVPQRPVLALVPSESFRDDGSAMFDVSDGGPAIASAAISGLWATEVRVDDWSRYEGWLWGLPELELHVQDARTRRSLACAEGTRSAAPHRLAFESGSSIGPVLLGADNELVPGTAFLVALYEDDGTPCSADAPSDVEAKIAAALDASRRPERAVFRATGAPTVSRYAPTHGLVPSAAPAAGRDELVGLMAGEVAISSSPVTLFLKDEVLATTATIVLQRATVVGY